MKNLFLILFSLLSINAFAKNVYVIDINDEINSKTWIYIHSGFSLANKINADLIVIHLNTYGGELNFADSIRTKILNSKIPVVAFVDNNAASAGALISLACDKIYMRKGASIGAATVVNGTDGTQMPDKYQAYMRSMMRSTTEAHGKDSLGNWVRDPLIADAMVDSRTVVPGIIDSTRTLTFTTLEAIRYNYCEGEAETVAEVLQQEGVNEGEYTLTTYKPTFWDKSKGLLTSTVLRGILIMLIIGGIWFELQQPGIGFPLGLAICAAILYFAPAYMDGLAANWEILLFIVGVGLLMLEIFVIPGFGVAGISGIAAIFISLVFSLLNNDWFNFDKVYRPNISSAVLTVTIGLIFAFATVLFFSWKIGTKGVFSKFALQTAQNMEDGFIGVPTEQKLLAGKTGIAITDMRPSGKAKIEGKIYDALSENGKFIEKNTKIEVINFSTTQINVRRV
ncbi:MAG: S49 family peptidase [Prevotellaceae bacterium]|jgi:membrane-bound serine protease (ClpP class)|nr:S49 family peptidase [Prevotellaceae bacterium]